MIDEYLEEASRLRAANKFDEAQALCERAAALDDADPQPHFLLGIIHLDKTDHRAALDAFEKANSLNPDNPDILLNLGMSMKEFGRFDEAREQFERAISIDENFAPGYYNLVSIVQFKAEDPLIDRLHQLLSKQIDNQHYESLVNYALGKIHDDIGEYDRAFEHYSRANELQGKVYNHQNTLTMFSRAKSVFTKEFMDGRKGKGNPSRQPTFIIGMPRTGSSLVEELLSRHDNIVGLGERVELGQIVLRLEKTHPSHTPYPEILPKISDEQFEKLGDLYLMLHEKRSEFAERFIDKNILNHSLAGFARLLFPQAGIILTQRDAIDTCLSSYFQNFLRGLEYTFDLEDLGKRYAAYADLMEHWKDVLGDGLYVADYEALTHNPNQEMGKLFAYIGMTAPTSLDKPADRAISTASAWQARQPVYQSSVKRWKNYEKHLGPLFKALENNGYQYAG